MATKKAKSWRSPTAVRHQRFARRQQDILGLDVSVDDGVAVGVTQRARHVRGDGATASVIGSWRSRSRRARSTDGQGKLRLEHLDRDEAIVLQVAGEVDRPHATAAEFPLDLVAAGQG